MPFAVTAVLLASLCAPAAEPLQLEGRIVGIEMVGPYAYVPDLPPGPSVTSILDVDYVDPASGLHNVVRRVFYGKIELKIGDPFVLESGFCSGFNQPG